MRMAWTCMVAALVVLGSVAGRSAEAGVRIRLESGGFAATLGWLAFSSAWGMVDLSGRVEAELVPARLRTVSGSARLPWEWGSARATVAHLGAGRTQLLTQLEGETMVRWDAAVLNLSVGTQARVTWGPFGRNSSLGSWTGLRVEALPWWGEVRGDVTWPWAGARWSVALGAEDRAWAQLRAEGSGLSVESYGLEWGGEDGRWTASMFLAVLPRASQSVTVRWGDEALRLLARLSVRSGALWVAQTGISGAASALRWNALLDWGPEGWRSAALEVRLTL